MAGKKDTEKKQVTRRKKQELCWVWQDGDNIEKVSQALTGYSYNVFKLLDYNHMQAGDIKPGTVIKWGIK